MSLCIKCKGKLLCKRNYCLVLTKNNKLKEIKKKVKKDFIGTNPGSTFISWKGYPKVTISPMTSSQILSKKQSYLIDDESKWYGLKEEKIIDFRSELIRSAKEININEASNPGKELQEIQLITATKKPIELEVRLKKELNKGMKFDSFNTLMGPLGEQEKITNKENIYMNPKIEKAYYDKDLDSINALKELNEKGVQIEKLIKVFSTGMLGKEKKRKLVPTRWSITAVDDTVSKEHIKKIKSFKEINEFKLFQSNYLSNNFLILLIPSAWSFEMLECWLPGSFWSAKDSSNKIMQDHEFYEGRKKYAKNITGAYYSARLAITEYLLKEKRQASAIVFREISNEYTMPFGVWQVRENCRAALKNNYIKFDSIEKAIEFIKLNLRIPIKNYLKESKLIDRIKNQEKIIKWIKNNV